MRKVAIFLIKIYKNFFSTFLKRLFGAGCRFNPSCSEYAMEAIDKFGFMKGSYLGLKRFFRCNPFSKSSWLDPVSINEHL